MRTITVYKKRGLVNFYTEFDILLDNEKVAHIKNGQTVSLQVDDSAHTIRVVWEVVTLTGDADATVRSHPLNIEAGTEDVHFVASMIYGQYYLLSLKQK